MVENKEMCVSLWVTHRRALSRLNPVETREAKSQCYTCWKVVVEASYNEMGEKVSEVKSGNPKTDCTSNHRTKLPL